MQRWLQGLLVVAAATLAACGGGGGGGTSGGDGSGSAGGGGGTSPAAQKAEGLWLGSSSANRAVNLLVLDNGTYWAIYSAVGKPSVIGGVVQGTYTVSGSSFASSDGRDYNLEGDGVLRISSIVGSYQPKSSFNSQLNYASAAGSVTLNANYSALYDTPATLSAVTGRFTGTSVSPAGPESVALTVSASGAISGTSGLGCSFNGTVSPRNGVGAFDVSIRYNGGECLAGTSTQSGAAYFDAANNRLYVAGLDMSRNNGFVFVGTKASGS
ncbi:hypothetical protein [Paracidovorax wautersii]|uniref:hypothetical protein n=1 Tax=Paracidovorax wautersii TaxID=1177982 RepID=UPI0031E3EAE8